MKKHPSRQVDDDSQYNANGGNVQLPRLVSSINQRAVAAHRSPHREETLAPRDPGGMPRKTNSGDPEAEICYVVLEEMVVNDK